MSELKSYPVWDAPTRAFHWINALSVIGLVGIGVVMIKAGALGIGNPGKLMLKTWHVGVGYVFVLNLCWRMAWAFFGNRHARWRELLPAARAIGAPCAATWPRSWPEAPNPTSDATRSAGSALRSCSP